VYHTHVLPRCLQTHDGRELIVLGTRRLFSDNDLVGSDESIGGVLQALVDSLNHVTAQAQAEGTVTEQREQGQPGSFHSSS